MRLELSAPRYVLRANRFARRTSRQVGNTKHSVLGTRRQVQGGQYQPLSARYEVRRHPPLPAVVWGALGCELRAWVSAPCTVRKQGHN
jgi:hypothetical protein